VCVCVCVCMYVCSFLQYFCDKCNITTQNAISSETQVSVIKTGERCRTMQSPYVTCGGRTKCGRGLCRAIHQCSMLGIGTHVTDLTS
jgi:hypothetical protein